MDDSAGAELIVDDAPRHLGYLTLWTEGATVYKFRALLLRDEVVWCLTHVYTCLVPVRKLGINEYFRRKIPKATALCSTLDVPWIYFPPEHLRSKIKFHHMNTYAVFGLLMDYVQGQSRNSQELLNVGKVAWHWWNELTHDTSCEFDFNGATYSMVNGRIALQAISESDIHFALIPTAWADYHRASIE